ncbi:hypothetical protein B0T25DRAFT_241194 [Lasiosphaeria hispida]|uniref:Uncharacterized protein n=1 Tax=Lasiosphaeria hispida TaxID=260671 RepID=A0AAJ0MC97_9PEZI|nr:hypothetical protein B0T25DRAFT_241194 [Lasiosphaeria hispida]
MGLCPPGREDGDSCYRNPRLCCPAGLSHQGSRASPKAPSLDIGVDPFNHDFATKGASGSAQQGYDRHLASDMPKRISSPHSRPVNYGRDASPRYKSFHSSPFFPGSPNLVALPSTKPLQADPRYAPDPSINKFGTGEGFRAGIGPGWGRFEHGPSILDPRPGSGPRAVLSPERNPGSGRGQRSADERPSLHLSSVKPVTCLLARTGLISTRPDAANTLSIRNVNNPSGTASVQYPVIDSHDAHMTKIDSFKEGNCKGMLLLLGKFTL